MKISPQKSSNINVHCVFNIFIFLGRAVARAPISRFVLLSVRCPS